MTKKMTAKQIKAMKQRNTERARNVGEKLSALFASGDVHRKTSYIFLKNQHVPAQSYSFMNQVLVFLVYGCDDARGFKLWQAVGRNVKKGSKADALIRFPKFKKEKNPNTGEDERVLYGMGWASVFDVSSTEGEPLEKDPESSTEFMAALPLMEMALANGITVTGGTSGIGTLGSFNPSKDSIKLGVKNESTWLHELAHWGDKQTSSKKLKNGQQFDQEIVAEFASAILMECLGYEVEDKSAHDYIQVYARSADMDVGQACDRFLSRAVNVVAHLLTLSGQLAKKET